MHRVGLVATKRDRAQRTKEKRHTETHRYTQRHTETHRCTHRHAETQRCEPKVIPKDPGCGLRASESRRALGFGLGFLDVPGFGTRR